MNSLSILEALGFFYIVMATGTFTAALLSAAFVSIAIGVQTAVRRYKRGEIEESKDLLDQAQLNRAIRTGH